MSKTDKTNWFKADNFVWCSKRVTQAMKELNLTMPEAGFYWVATLGVVKAMHPDGMVTKIPDAVLEATIRWDLTNRPGEWANYIRTRCTYKPEDAAVVNGEAFAGMLWEWEMWHPLTDAQRKQLQRQRDRKKQTEARSQKPEEKEQKTEEKEEKEGNVTCHTEPASVVTSCDKRDIKVSDAAQKRLAALKNHSHNNGWGYIKDMHDRDGR